PIMARITIDGTPKTMGTKLEIDPNIWGLKFGRVEGKSAKALSINQKLDNIRGRIDKIYEDMLKHEGFATAQKVKIKFLGVGVMEDAILKVFREQNLFELWLPLFPFGLFPIFLFGATPPRSLVLQRYPPWAKPSSPPDVPYLFHSSSSSSKSGILLKTSSSSSCGT